MEEKKKSAVSWVLTWAGQKKSSYVWSVILAVINVVFKIVPYFIIADVVRMFLDGDCLINSISLENFTNSIK